MTSVTRRGPRGAVHFAALLLAAWTMGLEQAHVLEWAPKSTYPGPLYTRLQESLYAWFGYVGSVVEVLAVLAALALAILSRRDRLMRVPLAAAAALEVISLIVFFAVVYPVNFRFPVHGSGAVPADWTALRDRWEFGHAIGFALFTAAFVLLLASAFRPCEWLRRGDESAQVRASTVVTGSDGRGSAPAKEPAMTTVSTYLNFQGQAEEAFAFYAKAFGTQVTALHRFSDMPAMGTGELPAEERNLVMHAELPIAGGHSLMASDMLRSMGHQVRIGNNTTLCLAPDSREEADRLYDALSEGGSEGEPMNDMPWGDYWGVTLDKYGIRWMINYHAA